MMYFDYNSTTPVIPEARQAALAAMEGAVGNPSSLHSFGKNARTIVENARSAVSAYVKTDSSRVIFTSGATEAINHAIHTAGPGRVLVSGVEHPAVLAALTMRLNREVEVLPVDDSGRLNVDQVLEQVDTGAHPALVAVMAANNETGIIQPYKALVSRLRERMVPTLVDAVQYVGRLPYEHAADYTVFTSHKIGGIKGAGVMVARDPKGVLPLIAGGGQEQGRRGGTEAVPAIAALGAAIKHLNTHRDSESRRVEELRDSFEAELLNRWPSMVIAGKTSPRIPNTSLVILPRMDSEPVVRRLADEGVAVSTGSACNTGSLKPSRVLMAMGFAPEMTFRAIRFSFGPDNTAEEVGKLLPLLSKCMH
jgi:cysteine desulfurase